LVVDQGPGMPKWNPTNYEHKFFGPVPYRFGIEESLNLVTARIGIAVGVEKVGQYLYRFGITDHVPKEYAMLIGAEETTVLKLATAYAMLDNGGKRIKPTYIDRVQDRNGVTIYRADDRRCEGCDNVEWHDQPPPELPDDREQIADPRSAYQTVSLMEGVIQRGTGRSIASLNRPLAGKTGTTNDSNDTWFVGFSPDLVCGVYVGFDTPSSLGKRETGASVAAPAFKEFMGEALKDEPAIPFRIPPGVAMVRVNVATGQLARPGDKAVIYEPFKPGTEPQSKDAAVVVDGSEPGAGVPPPDGAMTASASTEEGDAPVQPIPASSGGGGPIHSLQPVPASGTGGLY
jgi:penicillin-binding protein 1A